MRDHRRDRSDVCAIFSPLADRTLLVTLLSVLISAFGTPAVLGLILGGLYLVLARGGFLGRPEPRREA
jgi:hypothetical protein